MSFLPLTAVIDAPEMADFASRDTVYKVLMRPKARQS
jgi:hypothetical protein